MVAQDSNSIEQPFLTPQEVSNLLRVSVYTVRRWIKEGSLPAYKVGRGWRIRESAIAEWLDQHHSTNTGAP
jgi:excisionase family DNA binding protein